MKYFTIEEFTKSNTATKLGIDNNIPLEYKDNMLYLLNILDKFREYLNKPIIITSGYRSIKLNKAVGGVNNSSHTTGRAVDIICKELDIYKLGKELLYFLNKNNIKYDQLIFEKNSWLHFSLYNNNNMQRNMHFSIK